MCYTTCEYACPMLISMVQNIEAGLPPESRDKVGFVGVTFNPERDTLPVLQAYRAKMRLNPEYWTLLHGQPDDILALAVFLGVKYWKNPQGDFSHSNLITVLNPAGEIVYRQVGLHQPISETIAAIHQVAQDVTQQGHAMLSKSAARAFFFIGTIGFSVIFLGLTLDTMRQVPKQTNASNLTPQAIEGKHLWEKNNCMGCHTLLGEGAYYAPELTKVYDRRGPEFIKAMLRDPEAMYPGQRRMVNYELTPGEIDALVAFFKWIGEMDLNGFPPKPTLLPVAVPSPTGSDVLAEVERPKVFNQLCIACHSLGGQGGAVGPALDGVGSRRSYDNLIAWLTDPQKLKPGTAMPKLPLSPSDIVELASFLSQTKQSSSKASGQQG